jgi:hypothetical protein
MGEELAIRGPSWEKFIQAMTVTGDGTWVYRGQADKNWGLLPSVGRPSTFGVAYTRAKEDRLFREFRREAPRWEQHLSSALEFLALGQHYGLPTRLLDWSTNPLVGAWFACLDESAADGRLHMLRVPRHSGITDDSIVFDPFGPLPDVALVRVPLGVARITAQQGLFSLHPDPTVPWTPPNPPYMYEVLDIPSAEKPYFLQLLNIMGVNHARLMVDLAGHCSTLAWQYKTWP